MNLTKENIDIRAKNLLNQFHFSARISTLEKGRTELTSQEALLIAIYEAYKGAASVSPNPLVGCVVLDQKGKFISKGFHQVYGGPHAEVNAIHGIAPEELKEAHVFVTLEPCAHQGKTPSCAKMLASLPIAKVTYGLKDPNPLVAGQGAQILADAGKVVEHYNADDFNYDLTIALEELAEVFLYNFREQKTFMALKWAQSLDGKMALTSGESKWITNPVSREYAHYLRSIYDATLVGANTILSDNPELNIRLHGVDKKNKIIVFDPKAKIFAEKEKFKFLKAHAAENIYFILDKDVADTLKVSSELSGNILVLEKKNKKYDLDELNLKLFAKGIKSVLVEGGAKTIQYFLTENKWDRIYAFIAPVILGQGLSYSDSLNYMNMKQKLVLQHSQNINFESDILVTGTRQRLK
jgi:diaminohydroxyphosphoribosylaminopyrimidine deaminase/5-amino-6-(5-phosphoribosylamino)uracil reductase